MRSSTAKIKITAGFAAAMVVAGAFWIQTNAQAQISKTAFRASGVVSLTPGHTARLSVVTVNIPSAIPVELVFLDGQGNVLARQVGQALPGRALSLDLSFVPGISGNRMPIRFLVRYPRQSDQEAYVNSALEVADDLTGAIEVMGIDITG
jgi:hypothetical protein